jgi:hypothetical protein
MSDIKVHPMVQKMADTIPDPIPGDDKTNINTYIYDLELPDDEPGVSIVKTYAIDNLGRMALRYDANLLIICGVLPHIKKALHNPNNHVVTATALTCGCIARSGGAQTMLDEGFSLILMSIATDERRDFYVRDACTRAFGWLHVMREIESKH